MVINYALFVKNADLRRDGGNGDGYTTSTEFAHCVSENITHNQNLRKFIAAKVKDKSPHLSPQTVENIVRDEILRMENRAINAYVRYARSNPEQAWATNKMLRTAGSVAITLRGNKNQNNNLQTSGGSSNGSFSVVTGWQT